MKTLHLIRHAKSSWKDKSLAEKLPTCAYARLELDADFWTDIGPRRMRLTAFLTPKMFQ